VSGAAKASTTLKDSALYFREYSGHVLAIRSRPDATILERLSDRAAPDLGHVVLR
jgi:hypothetical protein